MLDHEPTGAGEHDSLPAAQPDATTADAAPPTPTKTTRRRRTAAAKVAPDPEPATAQHEVETPVVESAEPPARRTRRRATAAAAPAAAVPAETAPAEASVPAAGPPETTPKRTRTRKATAPAPEPAAPAVEAPAEVLVEAPAPRTRRRRATAAAGSPPAAEPAVVEPPASPEAPAAEAPAAEAAPVKGRARRTRASRASQPEPAGAAPIDPPAEETEQVEPEVVVATGGRTKVGALPPPVVTFVAPVATFMAPVAQPAAAPAAEAPAEEPAEAPTRRRRTRSAAAAPAETEAPAAPPAPAEAEDEDADDTEERRRRRRGRRGRGRGRNGENGELAEGAEDETGEADAEPAAEDGAPAESADDDEGGSSRRRRRRRRRTSGDGEDGGTDDPPNTVVHVREPRPVKERRGSSSSDDEVQGVRGSTRLEAKRQRRRDGRDQGRRRPPILSEAEFLARREAVDRVMVVRQRGDRTQIAVLEDDVLVEHYVTKASSSSYAGNVYLGRVQNVLPSMEAAFVDIGKARNAVLYAGEVDWDVAGLEGKARSIEHAMKSGDTLVVQVTKDPIGHKGARLTSQISLPGRYLVYVPGGSMTGISRKLPDTERSRLKEILRRIVPEDTGVIIRTAAEGASEAELTRDVNRLHAQWEVIREKAAKSSHAPVLLSEEPDLAIRVVRDVFNEDFTKLVVSGDEAAETLEQYVGHVAPDLAPRMVRHTADTDVFHDLRIDEQLMKAMDRKVWLPSGGSLVIDRTEAMTVIDVNTGKFTGQGGTLEQTVTRNNLEAAEEVVRQLRLRDIGGIIVIDFIDMVLESNRDLVLRRLTECLGRDRTKHQVAEVTSLGLVQMTRKRVGQGLLEAFSEPCPTCNGRGLLVHTEPLDESRRRGGGGGGGSAGGAAGGGNGAGTAAPVGGSRAARRGRRGAGADEPAVESTPAPELPAEVTEPPAAAAETSSRSGAHRAAANGVVAPAIDPTGVDELAEPAGLAGSAAGVTGRIGGTPPAAVDGAAPEPAPAPEPVAVEPAVQTDQAEPAPRRRRRAASRPAGSPAAVGAEPARPAV